MSPKKTLVPSMGGRSEAEATLKKLDTLAGEKGKGQKL
jgi:hypothetical protein